MKILHLKKKQQCSICKMVFFIIPFMLIFGVLHAQTGDYRTDCSNYASFNYGGYNYELWQSWGDACMVTKNNGDFYTQWSDIGNSLARKSKRPGAKNQSISFAVQNNFQGNVFFGAYGWSRTAKESPEDLIEYYIVENYGTYYPKDNGIKIGEIYSDGSWYDVYRDNKIQQPSIDAVSDDFVQIKSIRRDTRNSGYISCVNHFNKWEEFEIDTGTLAEVAFKIEGYDNDNPNGVSQGNAYISASMGTAGSFISQNNNGNDLNNKTFRLKNHWGNRYAVSNNTEWSIVREIGYRNWTSQYWNFEKVTNNEYRLKELYGNRYLTAGDDGIQVADKRTVWNSQIWYLENVSGSIYRIKSKSNGNYLQNSNFDWAALNLGGLQPNWDSQKWILEDVGAQKRQPTEPEYLEETDELVKLCTISPNPTNAIITINLSNNNNNRANLSIFDMSGRLITKSPNILKSQKLDVSEFESGYYFIVINQNGRTETKILQKR